MKKQSFIKKLVGKDSPLKRILIDNGIPLLANVMTGGTAMPVVNLVKDIIGVKSDNEDDIIKALESDPALLVRLKEFELNQKVELERMALQSAQIELDESMAYLSDRQNARKREMSLTSATGKRDWLLMALAIVVVLGFFTLIFVLITDTSGELQNSGPINQLFGALVAGFSMVLSYFFGSSKGSADKNATIERGLRTIGR